MMDEKFLHDTGVEVMRVVKTTLKAYRTFSKLAVEGEKVSVCGLQILTTLRYYPELNTVSDLADSLEFSKGLISREVETLRKGNYVTTAVDEKDRRVLRIFINKEVADPVILKQKEKLFNLIHQITDGIADEDIKKYRELNKIFLEKVAEVDFDKEVVTLICTELSLVTVCITVVSLLRIVCCRVETRICFTIFHSCVSVVSKFRNSN